jgi:3-oxoacyl-[acyl-carrier protein] reductase
VTETPMAQAWAAGEFQGGSKMLKYSGIYTNTELPPTQPIDQANANLYLASDMSKAVTSRLLTVDNGVFM